MRPSVNEIQSNLLASTALVTTFKEVTVSGATTDKHDSASARFQQIFTSVDRVTGLPGQRCRVLVSCVHIYREGGNVSGEREFRK